MTLGPTAAIGCSSAANDESRSDEALARQAPHDKRSHDKRSSTTRWAERRFTSGRSWCELGNLRLEARDALAEHPQLRQQRFDQEASGADDGLVGVQ